MRISDWSSDVCSSDLYGRFDFAWDGRDAPMLLDYRADAPTELYESSVVQWEWLHNYCSHCDQFNGIHERSEETGVGKECVSACRPRWSTNHSKNKVERTISICHYDSRYTICIN